MKHAAAESTPVQISAKLSAYIQIKFMIHAVKYIVQDRYYDYKVYLHSISRENSLFFCSLVWRY